MESNLQAAIAEQIDNPRDSLTEAADLIQSWLEERVCADPPANLDALGNI